MINMWIGYTLTVNEFKKINMKNCRLSLIESLGSATSLATASYILILLTNLLLIEQNKTVLRTGLFFTFWKKEEILSNVT